MNFHTGNFVKEIFEQCNTKQKAIADHLHYGASNISLLFKREDWYVSQLHAASKASRVNVFTRLGEVLLPYSIEEVPGMVMEDRFVPEPKLQLSWTEERTLLLKQLADANAHVNELKQLNEYQRKECRALHIENINLQKELTAKSIE